MFVGDVFKRVNVTLPSCSVSSNNRIIYKLVIVLTWACKHELIYYFLQLVSYVRSIIFYHYVNPKNTVFLKLATSIGSCKGKNMYRSLFCGWRMERARDGGTERERANLISRVCYSRSSGGYSSYIASLLL